jgi:hypothetical protein
MAKATWVRSVGAGVLALGLLVACSSKAQDGASCDKASDCSSGTCTAGACEGADCSCETADCRSRSSCQDGWLCTRGDVASDVITRCRKECKDSSSCPSDKHCDTGVCRAGPEPFALSWLNIPRTSPCAAKVPCEFTYPTGGSYEVLVRAHSDKGATADLHTTEALCQGAVGDACDTTVTICCQGTCVADLCK